MLSGLRFLRNFREVHQADQKWNITLHCDNISMVKRSSATIDLTRVYPNSTLDSDWDILAEIWNTMDQLGDDAKPSICHIKGHQDDDTDYWNLPLAAQLNVDADRLADQYLELEPFHPYEQVVLLPTSNVQLNILGGTVTHHLKRELRLARTTEPYAVKLCSKNGWTREVFDAIDWDAHGRALARNDNHHVTLAKYINGYAPVGRVVNRYDKKYPKECCSCNLPEETTQHLHQCPATSREKWRKDTITTVRIHLEEKDTPLQIIELFLSGLHSVLYNTDEESIIVPAGLEDLAENQRMIGWKHILMGRLSSQWQQHQQSHLASTNQATAKNNGLTWATDLASLIFKQWWKLWELRNGDRHGQDMISRAEAQKRQAIREMHQLYELKDTVLPQYQWILSNPIESKLHWPASVIRAWISNYRPLLEEEGYQTRLETG